MKRWAAHLGLAAALACGGCGDGSDAGGTLPELPARGTTPAGAKYSFDVTRASGGERGRTWCAVIATGAEPDAEHESCDGPVRRGKLGVELRLACRTGDLFLYGATPPGIESLRLTRMGEPAIDAKRYAAPSDAAVGGTPFLISTRASGKGLIEALDGDGRVAERRRLPPRMELCETPISDPLAFGSL